MAGREQAAISAGWEQTRRALAGWRAAPVRTTTPWVRASLFVTLGLLAATWWLASRFPMAEGSAGSPLIHDSGLDEVVAIFGRNLLVLALHAMVCVAGFLATTVLPAAGEEYGRVARAVHHYARPVALVFVLLATILSLLMQAVVLGRIAPIVAVHYDLTVPKLLLFLLPHALPELVALFLPLGAWLVLVRRRQWGDLLAASMITPALALPVLAAAAVVEVYVTVPLLERVQLP